MQTVSLGKNNPKLVELRKAVQNADLTRDGLLPIEGRKLLEEAIRSGIEVLDVFLRREVGFPSVPDNATIYELDASVFKSIQTTETSQGVIALVRPPTFSISDVISVAKPRIVILGRLQDPGNVGTILRVSESFFATGCLAIKGTVSVHNSKTLRSSAGSVFRLPYAWDLEFGHVVSQLRKRNIPLIGTSPGAARSIETWDWQQPAAILVGNEGSGLSDDELSACDAVLRITQKPTVESLNSAVATAVILYEAMKA